MRLRTCCALRSLESGDATLAVLLSTNIIQQVVPTKQSDWSTRDLDHAQISMTAHLVVLPHHYIYYSAIDLNYTHFHGNIVTATIGVELKLNSCLQYRYKMDNFVVNVDLYMADLVFLTKKTQGPRRLHRVQ